MAQQILKEVDGSFKSFFGLLKLAKQGKYPFSSCRLPKYLPKDGYATLIVGFLAVRHNSRRMRNSSLDRCFSCWHTVKYKTVPPFLIGVEHMFCINYSTWFHKREEKEL